MALILEELRGTELGELASLVARLHESTRAELARLTGLARSTISQRVDQLLRLGVLIEAGARAQAGRCLRRPPVLLKLNPAAGVVLAADLGATHSRVALASLSGHIEAERGLEVDIAEGPDRVLGWARAAIRGVAGRERLVSE